MLQLLSPFLFQLLSMKPSPLWSDPLTEKKLILFLSVIWSYLLWTVVLALASHFYSRDFVNWNAHREPEKGMENVFPLNVLTGINLDLMVFAFLNARKINNLRREDAPVLKIITWLEELVLNVQKAPTSTSKWLPVNLCVVQMLTIKKDFVTVTWDTLW